MLRHDAWPVRAQAATALATPVRPSTEGRRRARGLARRPGLVGARERGRARSRRLGGAGIAGLIRATRHADRYARARAEEALALIALKGATV